MIKKSVGFYFISTALILLIAGMFFGLIGSLQYVLPNFLKQDFPFYKTRPLHVSLVITWIISAAIGGLYYYLPKAINAPLYSIKLAKAHFYLFLFTTLTIITCFMLGYFGGREYLEYPPSVALIVALCWLLLMINFFKTIIGKVKSWPIYMWMWTTGVVFFLITYTESYLWVLPYFRDNVVRDVTVQWKSLGSMVGSWNMLIYGTAFYLMEKISGNDKTSHAPITFFFYFLGLTNLMFNWGHHTYIVPAAQWIRNVSYIISMTELLILGNIILNWRKTLSEYAKITNSIPYRFLLAADIWIFINLILAIFMSIPAINFYTHGTHITVAHSMGTTIGINTMILMASLYYIISQEDENFVVKNSKKVSNGIWVTNISLLIFWIALLIAGIAKAVQMQPGNTQNFAKVMNSLQTVFEVFSLAGFSLFIGIVMLAAPVLRSIFRSSN